MKQFLEAALAYQFNARQGGHRQSRPSRLLEYAVAAAFLVAIAVLAAALALVSTDSLSGKAIVVDGDSLQFADQKVRLEGIDAPEFTQTCTIAGQLAECGRLARNHLRSLIAGRHVECSGWQVDKYDRPLVRCMVGDMDLNAAMVRDGWAVSFGDFELEEAQASKAARGIWNGDFIQPQDWRREHAGEVAGDSGHQVTLGDLIAKTGRRIGDWFAKW